MPKHNTDKLPSVSRPQCGTDKGYQFHRRKNEITCLECRNAVAKIRALSRLVDPEKTRADRAQYRLENADQIKAYFAAFRIEHKVERNLYKIRYRHENPEIHKQYRRTRRARERNAPSEPYTTQLILDIYGTDCHICHTPIDLDAPMATWMEGWEYGLQLDHVIPLCCGGTDLIENIRPSHGVCNIRKSRSVI